MKWVQKKLPDLNNYDFIEWRFFWFVLRDHTGIAILGKMCNVVHKKVDSYFVSFFHKSSFINPLVWYPTKALTFLMKQHHKTRSWNASLRINLETVSWFQTLSAQRALKLRDEVKNLTQLLCFSMAKSLPLCHLIFPWDDLKSIG